MNRAEVTEVFDKLMKLNLNDLGKLIQDPSSPMMQVCVAKVIAESAKKGDHSRLDFILDRLVGKVTQNVSVSRPKVSEIKGTDGSSFKIEEED